DDADLAAVALLAFGHARLDPRQRVFAEQAPGIVLVEEAVLDEASEPVRHHHRPEAPPPSKLPPPPQPNPPPNPPPPPPPPQITGPPKPPRRPPPPAPITPTRNSATMPAIPATRRLAVRNQPIAPTAPPVASAPSLRPMTLLRMRPTIGTPTKRKI